jgi:hypothetical protein
MKKLLSIILLLLLCSPALAAEHAGSGAATTDETGWTGSNFGSLGASNVWGKRAFKLDATILKGHYYHYSVTIGGYSGSGTLQAYARGIKMSCSGVDENSPTPAGQTAISDNFDNTLALISNADQFSGKPGNIDAREGDTNGSFRFGGNVGQFVYLPDDPMVCPGSPGSSHLHMFACNLAVTAFTTYYTLRTTGGTSCGDSRYPVQRSAYWMPAMLDGAGHIVPPLKPLFYYKTIPTNRPECAALGTALATATNSTHVGYCVPIPNGLKYILGADMGDPNLAHGPLDSGAPEYGQLIYQCTSSFNTAKPGTGIYHSIDEVRAAGCTIGDFLYIAMTSYPCWDGVHTDTANHRSHMSWQRGQVALSGQHDTQAQNDAAYGTNGGAPISLADSGGSWAGCPADHPYLIPTFSWQMDFRIDANFVAGHWRLSCDEQKMQTQPSANGSCLHMDYMEGWSPTIKARWQGNPTTAAVNGGIGTGCINGRNNGNNGSLCDGYRIVGMGGNPGANEPAAASTLIPMPRSGSSRPLAGNGTFTGEIMAPSDGEFGLYGVAGFTATSVSLSLTDITAVGKHTGVGITTSMNDNMPKAVNDNFGGIELSSFNLKSLRRR